MNTQPPGQTRLVIVGATGMVGGYALRYALDDPAVGTVTAIGRRKLGISHPKLKEVLHQDFAECSTLADALSGQDAAVFCLGTYTGSVPDAELRKVTVDYTVEFARVLHAASPATAFSFLSGSGADPTGQSRLAFARYKGEAEKALLAAGFRHVYIFRPAYIYPVEPRKEPNFSYRLLRAVYPAFRVLFPNLVIPADDLARAMVDVVVRKTGEPGSLVLENRDIRAIVRSLDPSSHAPGEGTVSASTLKRKVGGLDLRHRCDGLYLRKRWTRVDGFLLFLACGAASVDPPYHARDRCRGVGCKEEHDGADFFNNRENPCPSW